MKTWGEDVRTFHFLRHRSGAVHDMPELGLCTG